VQAQRTRLGEEAAQERDRLEAAHRSERQRIEDMYGMQVRLCVRGREREREGEREEIEGADRGHVRHAGASVRACA
jgi:hypothetical protein